MLDTDLSLPDLFTAQAAATPTLRALEDERGAMSYAELESLTRCWAQDLIAMGVGKDDLVGILMPRCKEYVVAALAALRAGGAFLVLEMAYPDKLLQEVLADAQPKVVFTLASQSARIPPHIPKVELDRAQPQGQKVELPKVSPEQLAFVSYSSGTTGKPKGIANPHRAAVGSYALRFGLSDLRPGDRVGCNVFFIWEILRPLLRGATTVVVPDTYSYDPEGLLAYLQSKKVTETLMTPTLLATLLSHHGDALILPDLRTLWLNGEVVTLDLAHRAAKALPHVRLLNVYSISETHEVAAGSISDMLTSKEVQGRSVCPVGPLLDPSNVYILKEDSLDPVEEGEAGELCVSGPLLARGYFNLPLQTAKAFVPAPEGGNMYRTGDLARLLPSGNVEITGRIGGMIKTRGYTVHPSAVQAAIVDHLGVQACVVVGNGEGVDKRLVAYIVPDPLRERVPIEPTGHSPQANKLLQSHLAQYMIPTLWVEVPHLPTHSVSGKIDLASLPSPPSTRPSTRPTSPGSDAPALGAREVKEETLVELWSLILGVPPQTIRAGHTFFELGGHSLSLADLAGRLSKTLGFTVPLGALAADPSLKGHLAAIAASRDGHLAELQKDLPKVMREDSVLPPDVRPEVERKGKGKDILLTGATGYLGAFLLRSLAERTPDDVKIICLIRFPYPTENCTPAGLARIRSNLNDLGLWNDDLLDRIDVVPGNLPQSQLGLESGAFKALAERVGTVIHAAAAVNLVYPYAALRAANVGGTREILRLCALGGAALHHISTNGALPLGEWGEETHIPLEDAVHIPDGYGQTKWVAEQLVREAQRRGIDAHIYRPGTLSGCSKTGASNPYDMLDAVLIEALRMGVAPTLPGWKVELTPVNYVADAVAALATSSPAHPLGLYHLGNPSPPTAEAVFDTFASLGYPTERIPFAQWRERWSSTLGCGGEDPNRETPFTTSILKGGFPSEEALCAVPILADSKTQAVLAPLVGERPRVDARLWRTYARHFYARGWLPHGPAGLPQANGSLAGAAVPVDKPKGRLAGKVAVVTGASSGIGAAVALTLAREGAKVSLAARRLDALQKLKAQIVRADPTAQVLVSRTDVTSRTDVEALVKATEASLGPVDVLVSCAGVMYFTLMANVLVDQWEQTVDVNCKGLLHCLSATLPSMLARGTGHVVAISSDAGRKTFPGLGVYSASKFFVESTLQALRLETANSGLRVTSIQPGNVATDLLGMSTDQEALKAYGTPSGAKVLDPQNVADAILNALVQPEHVSVNEVLIEPREEPI